jgi:hypothetical protein
MIASEASFRGRLQALSIADTLSFLSDLRRDGHLAVEREGVIVDLLIEAGRIAQAGSSRAGDDLATLLLRWRVIDAERLDAAMREVATGAPLVRALLEAGGVDPGALRRARRRQALRVVLPLFEWRAGEYRFFEGTVPDGGPPGIDLPIGGVVAAGIRAVRDADLFAERIPSADRLFAALSSEPAGRAAVALRPAERFVLDLVDGSRTVGGIVAASGQPDREVRRILFLLLRLGRIRASRRPRRRAAAQVPAARPAPGEIVRRFNGMLGLVYRYLMREIGPVSDHLLGRSLRHMANDHPILFGGSRLGADGTLDLAPLRDNLAGLGDERGRGMLVDGLNELLYRELLVLRRTLGAEHEKRVLAGLRRESGRLEPRA